MLTREVSSTDRPQPGEAAPDGPTVPPAGPEGTGGPYACLDPSIIARLQQGPGTPPSQPWPTSVNGGQQEGTIPSYPYPFRLVDKPISDFLFSWPLQQR